MVGCAYLPSVKNKFEIRPVKNVACWENMGPNTACGSVTVSPEAAEGFWVTAGWKRSAEIIDPEEAGDIDKETAIERFSTFAKVQVVSEGYCKSAVVSEEYRQLIGREGSGDQSIYVICAK
jgi:hypothetical protein